MSNDTAQPSIIDLGMLKKGMDFSPTMGSNVNNLLLMNRHGQGGKVVVWVFTWHIDLLFTGAKRS